MLGELEEFQESSQEHQKGIFWCQNTRNLKQAERTIETHKLDQEKKTSSH